MIPFLSLAWLTWIQRLDPSFCLACPDYSVHLPSKPGVATLSPNYAINTPLKWELCNIYFFILTGITNFLILLTLSTRREFSYMSHTVYIWKWNKQTEALFGLRRMLKADSYSFHKIQCGSKDHWEVGHGRECRGKKEWLWPWACHVAGQSWHKLRLERKTETGKTWGNRNEYG